MVLSKALVFVAALHVAPCHCKEPPSETALLDGDDACTQDGSENCALSALQTRGKMRVEELLANTTEVAANASACDAGREIPFSSRKPGSECFADKLGDECSYECDTGYIAVGRHVCQTITIQGQIWKDKSFFGGNCYRLCPDTSSPCPEGQVPLRVNTSDAEGACMHTTCLTPDDAFRNVARGNYELWRRARGNRSGCYSDSVDLTSDKPKPLGGSDMTGLGLIMECIAVSMGWISRKEFLDRTNQTLSALAGQLGPGWNFTRGPKGWMPRYFDQIDGTVLPEGTEKKDRPGKGKTWSVMSTGLSYVGILFVQTFLLRDQQQSSTETGEIITLASKLMDMVDWHSMLCIQKFNTTTEDDVISSYNGTGIPFLMNDDGSCQSIEWPEEDGYYPYSEEITAAWLAVSEVCGHKGQEKCSMPAMVDMWKKVIGRVQHPNIEFMGYKMATKWSAYLMQLPFYTVHPANTEEKFLEAFKNQWLADWADYNSSVFYGDSSRYGIGAGPDMTWCSGVEYLADQYTDDPNDGKCRTWSPYSVAGYLPAAPEVIKQHLLQMLANGEATIRVPGTDYHVLWRKSIIDPAMNWTSYITMVDLAGELFGLSTLWLGVDFYRKNTDHFNPYRGYIKLPSTTP